MSSDGSIVISTLAADAVSHADAYGRRVSGYTKHSPTAKFVAGKPRDAAAEEQLPSSAPSVYDVPCDYVFPCASSNELGSHHATRIIGSNAKGVFEGALRPCTTKARR